MIKEGNRIINVMFITILSRVSGFAREITLASMYGATIFTDAYLISTAIPSVIFTGIGMALASVFISMYPTIIQKQGKDEAVKFTNSIFNIVILATIILSILTIIFVKPIVGLFAIGFNNAMLETTAKFTRILLPGIILIGVNHILTGYLEMNRKYEIPVFTNVPSNVLIIIFIFLSANRNIYLLVYGTQIGLAIQTILLGYSAFKTGFKYSFTINLKDKNMRKMLFLVMPVFIGIAARQLNVLVDKTLASTLTAGSVSALNFADKLNSFVYGVVILSIVTVVYPTITELAVNEDTDKFKDYIRQSISIIVLLVIPISAGAMCLSTPIVKFLFQRGSFNSSATFLTSSALFYYSIGMIGLGLSSIIIKVFYALQDTRTPVIIGGIGIAINIILNFILIKYMSHKGLALATSISSLFAAALLIYTLRSKLGCLGGKKILIVSIKVCIATILMYLGVRFFYQHISHIVGNGRLRESVSLLMSIIFGGLIYFLLVVLMKVEEVNRLWHMLKRTTTSI